MVCGGGGVVRQGHGRGVGAGLMGVCGGGWGGEVEGGVGVVGGNFSC